MRSERNNTASRMRKPLTKYQIRNYFTELDIDHPRSDHPIFTKTYFTILVCLTALGYFGSRVVFS